MAIVVGIFIGFIAQYRRLYLSRKSCLPISEEKAEKRRTSFMEVPQGIIRRDHLDSGFPDKIPEEFLV